MLTCVQFIENSNQNKLIKTIIDDTGPMLDCQQAHRMTTALKGPQLSN